MNLLIFGSRAVEIESTRKLIRDYIEKIIPDKILTANDPDGVCALAQEIAKEMSIPLTLYFLDKKRNQGMYHHRSVKATSDCDMVVFFYNGTSKGTANEIKVAEQLRKKLEIIKVEGIALYSGLIDIDKQISDEFKGLR